MYERRCPLQWLPLVCSRPSLQHYPLDLQQPEGTRTSSLCATSGSIDGDLDMLQQLTISNKEVRQVAGKVATEV
jgi:hypothetical protein